MPFSIGFGIGPLRWSTRLGGRGLLSARPLTPEEALGAGIALLGTVGAWGAVEGIAGNWGVTGRVFGLLFILGTVVSILDRRALALFLTSWSYWILAKLGYFDFFLWVFELPQLDLSARSAGEGVDGLMLMLLTALAGLVVFYVMVLLPPLIMWRAAQVLTNLGTGGRAGSRPDGGPDHLVAAVADLAEERPPERRALSPEEKAAWKAETRRMYWAAYRPSTQRLRSLDWLLGRTPDQRAWQARFRAGPPAVS